MNDEDARSHEVSPAAEQSKNARRFGAIGRFADQSLVERDERIGRQNDAAGMARATTRPLRRAF